MVVTLVNIVSKEMTENKPMELSSCIVCNSIISHLIKYFILKNKNLDINSWNAKHLSRKQPLIIPIPSRGYGKLSCQQNIIGTKLLR
jgi:hypothetical protein